MVDPALSALVLLGTSLAKIVIRSHGLTTLSDWADLVGDAGDTAATLSGLVQHPGPGAQDLLGGVIADELSRRLGGIPANDERRDDLAAAATDVTDLFEQLRDDDDALCSAARDPERFHEYVLDHGGRKLLSYTGERTAPFAETILTKATEVFTDLALRSERFPAAALQSMLRTLDRLPQVVAKLHHTIHDPGTGLLAVAAHTAAMSSHLTDGATREQVTAYLSARLMDWDTAVWFRDPDHPAPSMVERRLKVRGAQDDGMESARMDADAALAAAQMLVVLGGPGSGKTWLAQRCARHAAQAALDALHAGAAATEVELPVLTTWDRWVHTPGSTQESLIAAGFDADAPHTAFPTSVVAALQRSLNHPDQPVLMIVDSLDEAANVRAQTGRLAGLETVTGWHILVTSRPAAWDASHRPTSTGGPTVATLQDLTYPRDVEEFISAWFSREPSLGHSLAAHIRRRPELQRGSIMPLLLTFYCILAAEQDPDSQMVLPARRHELYKDLVRALLLGEWRSDAPGAHNQPDPQVCEALLGSWAWNAVKDQNTPAGLGAWEETFTPAPGPVSHPAAIDNIAPPQQASTVRRADRRRFLHRTLQEHFVAEHVATLPTDQAAEILLPHLWFDPDWQIAAPAAIASHNRTHPGQLLDSILAAATSPLPDQAHQIANEQIQGLLLAVAVWFPPNRGGLGYAASRSSAAVFS